MHILVLILVMLVMLAGLAGTILPVVPGIPIIWLGMLGYGLYDGWAAYGLWTMVVTGLLVAGSIVVDQLAGLLGAKKFGASRAGMIGSVAGAIIGTIVFALPGLVLGTFLGAMACELIFSRSDFKGALASGTGALLGFLAGSLFKFMLGAAMIGYFLFRIIFG